MWVSWPTSVVAYQWDWDKREISAIPIIPRELHLGRLLKSGTAFYITSRTAFKSGTAIAMSAE